MNIAQANRVAKAIESIAAVAESSSQLVFEALCDSGIFHQDDDCDMIEDALEDS